MINIDPIYWFVCGQEKQEYIVFVNAGNIIYMPQPSVPQHYPKCIIVDDEIHIPLPCLAKLLQLGYIAIDRKTLFVDLTKKCKYNIFVIM